MRKELTRRLKTCQVRKKKITNLRLLPRLQPLFALVPWFMSLAKVKWNLEYRPGDGVGGGKINTQKTLTSHICSWARVGNFQQNFKTLTSFFIVVANFFTVLFSFKFSTPSLCVPSSGSRNITEFILKSPTTFFLNVYEYFLRRALSWAHTGFIRWVYSPVYSSVAHNSKINSVWEVIFWGYENILRFSEKSSYLPALIKNERCILICILYSRKR